MKREVVLPGNGQELVVPGHTPRRRPSNRVARRSGISLARMPPVLVGSVVFLSAFLLFQVQLIVSKHLLPWFGGTPAVWTTSQMFFQFVLLVGYAYAHRLTRAVSPARQGRLHAAILISALGAVVALAFWAGTPLLVPASMTPTGAEHPSLHLLVILIVSVGLPFFVLSTTAPLLQQWHSRQGATLQGTYRLYALSNVGSFLGLFSYSLVVERLLELTQQAWVWTLLFVLFVAGTAVAARRASRSSAMAPAPVPRDESPVEAVDGATPVSASRIGLWLFLSVTGSVVFLATTNQLTQDVAAVPFLWALPLGIYLLTFIICFDRPHWYSRRWMPVAAAIGCIAMLPTVTPSLPVAYQIAAYCFFLFTFCMLCHGELVRLRPGAGHLTLFYLLVALGGALGGIFVGIVAPAAFPDFWEFPLAMLMGWLALSITWAIDRQSPFHTGDRGVFAAVVAVGLMLAVRYPIERTGLGRVDVIAAHGWMVTFAGGLALAAGACAVLWRSRIARSSFWPQAMVVLLVLLSSALLWQRVGASRVGVLYGGRNFYGVVRVESSTSGGAEFRQLKHGTTTHGVQVEVFGQRLAPTAYYSPSSGIALASTRVLRRIPNGTADRHDGVHFGVLGMGVGTMAAFASTGDRIRFYEINPQVIALAHGPGSYFSFVKDTRSEVTIVEGDARLLLERELQDTGSQRFDLLAMDAFSSDSIPVHLVTAEAFRLYAAHLAGDEAILAVNVTNRYLDLEPVVAAGARDLGFDGVRVDSAGNAPAVTASSWILLTRHPAVLARLHSELPGARPLRPDAVRFTDRYSNLFRVLK